MLPVICPQTCKAFVKYKLTNRDLIVTCWILLEITHKLYAQNHCHHKQMRENPTKSIVLLTATGNR